MNRFILLFIGTLLFSSFAFSKTKSMTCNDLLSNYSKFDKPSLKVFSGRKKHAARLVGEQMSDLRMIRNLNYLTGVLPLDSAGCISDRCTLENKIRTRQFFVDYGKSLGFDVVIETVPKRFGFIPKLINVDEIEKPESDYDLKKANDEELLDIWTDFQFERIIEVLQAVYGWDENDYEKLRDLDVKDLEAISKWPSSPLNEDGKQVIKFFNGKHINLSELEINPESWEKKSSDARKLLKLLNAQAQYESAIIKAKEHNERVEELLKEREEYESRIQEPSVEDEVVNIIFEIKGTTKPNQVVEVSAHYDTVSPNVPGADDNGSGVITMLEMADLLKDHPPKRTTRLVFTDLEERGKDGSIFHANSLVEKDESIIGAIILDMFGYAPLRKDGEKPVFVLEMGTPSMHRNERSYKNSLDMAIFFAQQFNMYDDRMVRLSVETDGSMPGTTDLGPFWSAGHPGFLISAPYEGNLVTPGYHTSNDTIKQMNWMFFTEIAQVTIEALARYVGMDASNIEKDEEVLEKLNQHYQSIDANTGLIVDIPKKTETSSRRSSSSSYTGIGFFGGSNDDDGDNDGDDGWWD